METFIIFLHGRNSGLITDAQLSGVSRIPHAFYTVKGRRWKDSLTCYFSFYLSSVSVSCASREGQWRHNKLRGTSSFSYFSSSNKIILFYSLHWYLCSISHFTDPRVEHKRQLTVYYSQKYKHSKITKPGNQIFNKSVTKIITLFLSCYSFNAELSKAFNFWYIPLTHKTSSKTFQSTFVHIQTRHKEINNYSFRDSVRNGIQFNFSRILPFLIIPATAIIIQIAKRKNTV